MNIVIDDSIPKGFQAALADALAQLELYKQQRNDAQKQADANTLMRIPEACAYMGGINEDTLLYYRKMGLDYYKKGKAGVWYRKGDIDDWLASGKVSRHSR